ncbi:MAG: LptF/LptG family permease [Verrucomicrobia bacterium]|nr:LptF/LptG family permease [Verrucomicrobiota bacterium]
MKLIDKYILRSFLAPFVYCLAAFLLVFIVFDLFDNLSDFVNGNTPMLRVLRYYVTLVPTVLVFVTPISLLLGILYSLSSMTKNNELTAMRASGISLYRLMTPFLVVGFLSSIVVAVVHETISPQAAYWCDQFVKEQRNDNPESVHIADPFLMVREQDHRTWFVSRFNTRTYEMGGVEVTTLREDNTTARKLTAQKASWLDHQWIFEDVVEQKFDTWGNPMGPPRFSRYVDLPELTEVPADFMVYVKKPEFMSSRELLLYLNANQNFQKETLARFKVDLHYRLAQPWTCLVITLLGIPFGNHTGRKGALAGIMLCFGLFFGYYAVMNLILYIGKEALIPAWLAAWLPNALFLITGSVMLSRMR